MMCDFRWFEQNTVKTSIHNPTAMRGYGSLQQPLLLHAGSLSLSPPFLVLFICQVPTPFSTLISPPTSKSHTVGLVCCETHSAGKQGLERLLAWQTMADLAVLLSFKQLCCWACLCLLGHVGVPPQVLPADTKNTQVHCSKFWCLAKLWGVV